ncbi:hypothetical protein KAFR_0G03530 [Kazachstania africana CBS 2517]|uniref:Major facilitator superfamily (MFS) profile domain-containing protein n=1 Tax=Kazachstania africana (strain ATCC 22294 / BCRC 22015 / CBS 2517 / CECT 1963 / NBRC 1671 / NRRL Y-8276) TaxID=1071382 RepID=H2AYD5_KAZAF|nr:hypothetical protein KAFR_0G03530 [Kazachstania africana CBS 2517]CCF59385.1 hypothetical protein KAFR_0G03530 [Kazachstania africana CBS 2517]
MPESTSLISDTKKRALLTNPLIFSTLVACMGSIQYGYHIAELNAPQQSIMCPTVTMEGYEETYLGSHGYAQCITLTDQQYGAITAMFSVGGLVGSFFGGRLANRYGRKFTSFITCTLGLVGSCVLFASNNYAGLLIGRIIVGVACGVQIVVTPLYINEITPAVWRGAMGSMNQLSINLGILLTQSLAIKLANELYWRWLLLVGAAIAAINFVCWIQIYESPKWLLRHTNKLDKAENALSYLRSTTYQEVKNEINDWKKEFRHAEIESGTNVRPLTFWQYVRGASHKKPRDAITAILMGQQFCGINSIIFYGVKIISRLLPEYAIFANFGVSIINVVVTFLASLIVDQYGRKPLLLTSTIIMSAASFFISISIINLKSVSLIISIFVYISAFAIGLGPIPFLIIGELSTAEESATAQSYGTVCNWLATFVIGYGFPLVNNLMGGYVYMLFAAFAISFAYYIYERVPETKSKTNYTDIWADY